MIIPLTVVVEVLTGLVLLIAPTESLPAERSNTTAPNVDAIRAAAHRSVRDHCSGPACQALRIISEAVELQIDGSAVSVGRPRPIPSDRDQRVAASYRRLVRRSIPVDHAVCSTGASVLSRYSEPGVVSDVVVPVALLDLAGQLDQFDGDADCVTALLSALPRTLAAQMAIRNAHALCLADRASSQRCSGIAR